MMKVLHWYKELMVVEMEIMNAPLTIGKKISPDNEYEIEVVSPNTVHIKIRPDIIKSTLEFYGGKAQFHAFVTRALTTT